MNEKLKKWCQAATDQIRYKPDRAEVEAELMAHMEDKADALRAQGISEEELENAVLRSMGSAEVIAPQLAAIHKPFWGYVYSGTKAALCVLMLLLFVLGSYHLMNQSFHWSGTTGADSFDSMTAAYEEVLLDYVPNVSDRSDGYTYTVTRAGIWKTDWESWTEYVCMLKIRVFGILPWENRHPTIENFWAEDSLGNRYVAYDDYIHNTTDTHTQVFTPTEGFLSATYDVILRGFDTADAQWVKLHYDRDGRDIVLHIDLTGGDGK